jgi:hypothetical protein
MAYPTFVAASALRSTGNGSTLSAAWPTHQIGDLAFLAVERDTGTTSLSTANGFVIFGSQITATGTTLTVFYCRATSAAMPAPVIASGTDHLAAVMVTFRNAALPRISATSTKNTASTSLTMPLITTEIATSLVVGFASTSLDNAGSWVSAITNANLTSITERFDNGTSSGNGGGLLVWTGQKAVAGSTGTTAVTVTSSTNAMLTLALAERLPGYAVSYSSGLGTAPTIGLAVTWDRDLDNTGSGTIVQVISGNAASGQVIVQPNDIGIDGSPYGAGASIFSAGLAWQAQVTAVATEGVLAYRSTDIDSFFPVDTTTSTGSVTVSATGVTIDGQVGSVSLAGNANPVSRLITAQPGTLSVDGGSTSCTIVLNLFIYGSTATLNAVTRTVSADGQYLIGGMDGGDTYNVSFTTVTNNIGYFPKEGDVLTFASIENTGLGTIVEVVSYDGVSGVLHIDPLNDTQSEESVSGATIVDFGGSGGWLANCIGSVLRNQRLRNGDAFYGGLNSLKAYVEVVGVEGAIDPGLSAVPQFFESSVADLDFSSLTAEILGNYLIEKADPDDFLIEGISGNVLVPQPQTIDAQSSELSFDSPGGVVRLDTAISAQPAQIGLTPIRGRYNYRTADIYTPPIPGYTTDAKAMVIRWFVRTGTSDTFTVQPGVTPLTAQTSVGMSIVTAERFDSSKGANSLSATPSTESGDAGNNYGFTIIIQ